MLTSGIEIKKKNSVYPMSQHTNDFMDVSILAASISDMIPIWDSIKSSSRAKNTTIDEESRKWL